jgi:hypothetical protein
MTNLNIDILSIYFRITIIFFCILLDILNVMRHIFLSYGIVCLYMFIL